MIIIPSIILIVLVYGLYKKINIFTSFTKGVGEGLKIILDLFPTIFAMILSINILTSSHLLEKICSWLNPIFETFNFPPEILPLAMLRPISGSSSLMYLNYLLKTYGPDSNIGMIASIIQSGTDTTIYIIALYFGVINIKKIRHSLLVGLFTDFLCVTIAVVLINSFYN